MEELLYLNDEQFINIIKKLNYEELEELTKNMITKLNKKENDE